MLVTIDFVAVVLAWLLMLTVSGDLVRSPVRTTVTAVTVAFAGIALAAHWGLYLSRVSSVRSSELAALMRVSATSAAIGWFASRIIGLEPGWFLVTLTGIATFLVLAAARASFDAWIKSRRRDGAYCRRILLVGCDDAAIELLELVEDQPELGYRVVGYVGPHNSANDRSGVRWVGDYDNLPTAVDEHAANGVIVATSTLGDRVLRSVLCDLVEDGVHVQLSTGLQGLDHRRLRASTVGYEPVLYLERTATTAWQRSR